VSGVASCRCVFKRLIEAGERRVQSISELDRRGDMHGGGKGVVGRLAEIDVIVGMDRMFRSQGATKQLARPVGDHLV
jgi:hypothetical protein